jgi:predicted N-acetyltransferase YhbS
MLEFRELHPDDVCTSLRLGDAAFTPLKTFLRKEAKRLHQAHLARTYVVVEKDGNRILGYATTLCTQISTEQFGDTLPIKDFRYKDYPAVKLARLAVDVSLQGQGVGGQLLDLVMGLISEQVMPHIGCRFLVVDSKVTSVNFYTRKGFVTVGSVSQGEQGHTTMVIDLNRNAAP